MVKLRISTLGVLANARSFDKFLNGRGSIAEIFCASSVQARPPPADGRLQPRHTPLRSARRCPAVRGLVGCRIDLRQNQLPLEIRTPTSNCGLLRHTLTESLHKRPTPSPQRTFARQLRHIEQLQTHIYSAACHLLCWLIVTLLRRCSGSPRAAHQWKDQFKTHAPVAVWSKANRSADAETGRETEKSGATSSGP